MATEIEQPFFYSIDHIRCIDRPSWLQSDVYWDANLLQLCPTDTWGTIQFVQKLLSANEEGFDKSTLAVLIHVIELRKVDLESRYPKLMQVLRAKLTELAQCSSFSSSAREVLKLI